MATQAKLLALESESTKLSQAGASSFSIGEVVSNMGGDPRRPAHEGQKVFLPRDTTACSAETDSTSTRMQARPFLARLVVFLAPKKTPPDQTPSILSYRTVTSKGVPVRARTICMET